MHMRSTRLSLIIEVRLENVVAREVLHSIYYVRLSDDLLRVLHKCRDSVKYGQKSLHMLELTVIHEIICAGCWVGIEQYRMALNSVYVKMSFSCRINSFKPF